MAIVAAGLLARSARRRAEAATAGEASFRAVFENALDAIVVYDDDGRVVDANGAVATVLGIPREELIGDRIGRRAPPESQDRVEQMRQALRDQRALRGEYEYALPDGGRRTVEFTAVADYLPGRHLSIVRDVTDRKREHETVIRRAAEQAVSADLSRLALRGTGAAALADEAVTRVAAALGADYVALFELLDGGEELLLRAGAGWRDGASGSATVGAGDPLLARALARSEPVVLEDLGAATTLLREHGVVSGVGVGIRGRDVPYGVLCAYSREPRAFTHDELGFLRVVANTAAMAIERDRDDQELHRASERIRSLAAERQRIVAEALDAEDRARERISQQLHDGLLQSLYVIRQDLAELAKEPERRDLLTRARDVVHEAIGDLRAAVFDLHPVVLGRSGLRAAVSAVAQHHAALGGFEVRVEIEPGAEGEHDRLLLSLVRELLSNVLRHAGARHAAVVLRRTDGELWLEVCDDGAGVDPAQVEHALAGAHIGLASAAQRVEALGGRFELLARPSGGTIARATIPLPVRNE